MLCGKSRLASAELGSKDARMLLNPPLYLHLHDSHLGRRELSHCCAGTCGRGSQGCACRLLRPRSRVVRVLVTSQRNPFGPSDDLSVTIKGRSPNPKLLLPRHTCTQLTSYHFRRPPTRQRSRDQPRRSLVERRRVSCQARLSHRTSTRNAPLQAARSAASSSSIRSIRSLSRGFQPSLAMSAGPSEAAEAQSVTSMQAIWEQE